MSVFYKDGNRNSNMRINTDGKLYKWLETNYYVDDGQILISRDVLEAIQEQQPEFEANEDALIGNLIFNLEYNGGYIFREILSFEDLIDEIDPDAFVAQSAVIGVYGQGFDRFKVKKRQSVKEQLEKMSLEEND